MELFTIATFGHIYVQYGLQKVKRCFALRKICGDFCSIHPPSTEFFFQIYHFLYGREKLFGIPKLSRAHCTFINFHAHRRDFFFKIIYAYFAVVLIKIFNQSFFAEFHIIDRIRQKCDCILLFCCKFIIHKQLNKTLKFFALFIFTHKNSYIFFRKIAAFNHRSGFF